MKELLTFSQAFHYAYKLGVRFRGPDMALLLG